MPAVTIYLSRKVYAQLVREKNMSKTISDALMVSWKKKKRSMSDIQEMNSDLDSQG